MISMTVKESNRRYNRSSTALFRQGFIAFINGLSAHEKSRLLEELLVIDEQLGGVRSLDIRKSGLTGKMSLCVEMPNNESKYIPIEHMKIVDFDESR